MKDNQHTLGKVDYNHTGRKNCKVDFEWELKEKDGKLCFTMSGNIWNPRETDIYEGGQCCDRLAAMFPEDKKAQRMVEIWKEYHLNDMQAGCEHQRAENWTDKRIDPSELPEGTIANRDERGVLAIWVRWNEHPEGLLCKPCSVCGYKYGSAWLYKEIPEEIIKEIKSW